MLVGAVVGWRFASSLNGYPAPLGGLWSGVVLRRTARFRSTLVALVASASLLVSAPTEAADTPPFVLDVSSLPQGEAPHLPYLDGQARKIVDGTREVDVRGLQGTVTQVHKVDGGYLLGRTVSGLRSDLVFLSSSGRRTLITQQWRSPTCDCFRSDVAVDSDGDSVTFNRKSASGTYSDTLTVSLPALKITRKREFSSTPALFEHRQGSVLLGLDNRLIRWNPRSNAVTVASSGLRVEAADTTAAQQVRRLDNGTGQQVVEAISPATGTSWGLGDEESIAAWSADDHLIAGGIGVYANSVQGGFAVWRASDGSNPLVVYTFGMERIVWEDAATVLFTAYAGDGTQVVRCTLAGACERVGPPGIDASHRGFLVATRRSN